MAVIRLDSVENFEPRVYTEGQVIGHPDARAVFVQCLTNRIAPRGISWQDIAGREIVANADQLHSIAAVSLHQVIETVGRSVGGKLQTAKLTAEGTTGVSIDKFDPETLGTPQFKPDRISAAPREVHTGTHRDHRRMGPSTASVLSWEK
jgi:hypothetical protein